MSSDSGEDEATPSQFMWGNVDDKLQLEDDYMDEVFISDVLIFKLISLNRVWTECIRDSF